MATAIKRRSLGRAVGGSLGLAALAVLVLASHARAVTLDDRGEMRFGMRAYTAARIGTQTMGSSDDPLTFPGSGSGHLRQHRYFLDLKLDHDIRRLGTTTKGLAWLLGWMNPQKLAYSLQYRGEGEGIYDYGPREWTEQFRKTIEVENDIPEFLAEIPPEYARRRVDRLRRIARQRHRLLSAYVDVEKGPVFVRIGRQVLAWGETDVFRLLDNINPLDDSFGGFFIALDERRLPLEMIRASYAFGSVGPLHDTFLEGFAAVGNRVSTWPGIPAGSPWMPSGLGHPLPNLRQEIDLPAREDLRGGARLVFNFKDITWTLAHYYTYFDIPGVQFRLPGAVQLPGETDATSTARFGNEIQAIQRFPRVPVTGASATFPIPSLYTVVRSEAAYFQDEPMNRQGDGNSANSRFPIGSPQANALSRNLEGGLNPFVYPAFLQLLREKPVWGRVLQRDTFNFALGFDVNRYIRFLNPTQTFFFSTQFFYKHVFDSPGDLVLPVPFRNIPVNPETPVVGQGCLKRNGEAGRPCRLQPRLLHLDDNRFLHTLLVTTAYSGGRIIPSLGMFYDWQGAIVLQPGVALVRDPFRFITDFSWVNSVPSGQFGAVRDRDNIRFQVEYVF
jgi:hypothetical protein